MNVIERLLRATEEAHAVISELQDEIRELRAMAKGKGLNEWAIDIHNNAKSKGWWEENRELPEIIALCHSELSECLEEYRNGKPEIYMVEVGGKMKPEGIGIELADTIIRILDYCGRKGINMDEMIAVKHQYNTTREYKPGGKIV